MKPAFLFALLFWATAVSAQSGTSKKIAEAVDALHTALVNLDSNTLDALTADDVSFGHSSGKVEDKQTFIRNAVRGSYKFNSIAATDEKITVSKRMAVVRYVLDAKATNNGAPADVKLGVLQVWQKQKGTWKLLARQAVKL